jgi:hypothetical protein
MQIEFMGDAQALGRRFSDLAGRATRIEIAVAWAGRPNCGVQAVLWKARSKVSRFVVGCALYNTHPDFLEKWQNQPNFRVIRDTDEIFHPKLYLFWMPKSVVLLVGSSNLTDGGFEKNQEANVLLSSGTPTGALAAGVDDICRHFQSGAPPQGPGWSSWLSAYRKSWARRRAALKPPGGKKSGGSKGGDIEGLTMWSWAEYFRLLRKGNQREEVPLTDWLEFLEHVRQQWGACQWSLARVPRNVRREIASIPMEARVFGTIGQGYFLQAVVEASPGIDKALTHIPRTGSVSDSDWISFSTKYSKAFSNAAVGSASRLLCLWRPDVFFSANEGSNYVLSRSFGFSRASLKTWAGYWEAVKLVGLRPWSTAAKPVGTLAERCWQGRVALLDVLMYEP